MKINTKIIVEIIVAVALAYALNLMIIFRLPQGGSITAISMIPIFWLALRRGVKIGVFGGVVFGLVDVFPQPFVVHPIQFLLDYPLAFGALGFAGLFKNKPIAGVITGTVGRFINHFISGVIFFGMYAPSGVHPAIYSAIYNGSYLTVELILSIIAIKILAKRGVIKMHL